MHGVWSVQFITVDYYPIHFWDQPLVDFLTIITQLLMLMAIAIHYCFTDVLVVVYDWIYTIFMFIQLVTTTTCKNCWSQIWIFFIQEK